MLSNLNIEMNLFIIANHDFSETRRWKYTNSNDSIIVIGAQGKYFLNVREKMAFKSYFLFLEHDDVTDPNF